MKFQRRFTRRDGTSFVVDITIDPEKIAQEVALSMSLKGTSKANRLNGGVLAKLIDDGENV